MQGGRIRIHSVGSEQSGSASRRSSHPIVFHLLHARFRVPGRNEGSREIQGGSWVGVCSGKGGLTACECRFAQRRADHADRCREKDEPASDDAHRRTSRSSDTKQTTTPHESKQRCRMSGSHGVVGAVVAWRVPGSVLDKDLCSSFQQHLHLPPIPTTAALTTRSALHS